MMLLTKQLKNKLLANGAKQNKVRGTRDEIDFRPVVKFFHPLNACRWLITELDPDNEDHMFGLCDMGMGFPELGTVSFSEMKSVRVMGLGVERDRYFEADKTLSEYASIAYKNSAIIA